MTSIIKVGETINANETMTSLQIAEVTGKQHSHIMRDIRVLLEKGLDVSNFGLKSFADNYGRSQPMYVLTKKGCLILASGYDALLREKIINRWEELELEKQSQFKIPQTYSEALLLASQQAEKIEQQQKLLAVKDIQIGELQPKASYYDQVLKAKDAIVISVIAKDYGMSAKSMNTKLHELGIQYKTGNVWLVYQKFADKGYTKTDTYYVEKTNKVNITTKWTQSGRLFIYESLKSVGILPIIER